IVLDNAYSPPKAVEQIRKLVEDNGIFAEVGTVGTVPNVATQKYMNEKKVPQLFISAGGKRFNDPANFPWTVPLYPNFELEGAVAAKYVMKAAPNAKIGILYQNDDFGKDYAKGFKSALGAKASQVVVEASYELADPTIDSQIVKLRSAGVDTLVEQSTPKFAAQSIRKVQELGWSPLHIVGSSVSSIDGVLKPAGLEASKGLVTTQFLKQPSDPTWANDPEVLQYKEFMKKYDPADNLADYFALSGYVNAQAVALVLKMCGDQLTRENLIKQASSLKGVRVPMLLPGITLNTSPSDFSAYKALRVARFDGANWVLVGEALSAD
ncbi:MAG TPA: ABC transporter substrate-binding protein, partial [Chthoniobacterales bacterium]